MTKQAQNIVGSDVPPIGGAGAPDVEVTPEMIDAGVVVLEKWQKGSEWDYRQFIAQLYRAMLSQQTKRKPQTSRPKRTRC
jgi:hypothetical protein